MKADEMVAVFDEMAPNYDKQWEHMAPVSDGLYFFFDGIFRQLDVQSHILIVGAGTGRELRYLAQRFEQWHFTLVEPSAAMMAHCKKMAGDLGITGRCTFHQGYLDTLDTTPRFDGATCILVSQFITDDAARTDLFRQIRERLNKGGTLISVDLGLSDDAQHNEQLLDLWLHTLARGAAAPEMMDNIKKAYKHDVAILPPARVKNIIADAGFSSPLQFYQSAMVHGYMCTRREE